MSLLLAGLAMAVQQAPPASAPYPEAEVLRLFRKTCSRIDDVQRTSDEARELGWEPFDATVSTTLGHAIAERKGKFGKTVIEIAVDKAYTFRQIVAGRELFLMVLDEHYPGSERLLRSRICSVFDYRASAHIGESAAAKWAGRAPDYRFNILSDMMVWEPGVTGIGSRTTLSFKNEPDSFLDPGLELTSRLEDWNHYDPLLP